MKKLLLTLTATVTALALAQSNAPSKTFLTAIDPSPDNTALGATNHVIYLHRSPLSVTNLASATIRMEVGSSLTNQITLGPGRWYAVATCTMDGKEGPPCTNLTLVSLFTTVGIREVKP